MYKGKENRRAKRFLKGRTNWKSHGIWFKTYKKATVTKTMWTDEKIDTYLNGAEQKA